MVHYLKKNEPSLSELRKCFSLAFGKQYYVAVRMSKPRPQLRRNKSSRVGDSNFHLFVINRRTPKHKKDWSVLLCIQDQSVTKHSTKLNQQNNSYCLSREKLLISGDNESNPGHVARGTSTHIVLRSPSMGLLQAQLAEKRLKALECTFFSSVAHQLQIIRINESIEGWATVTGIRPISKQHYNDNISGYEISSVTNVNNYSEVIID